MQSFSLSELGLVDGPEHHAFDNLTELAKRVTGASVSLVSTVDPENDRQFFTSHLGLGEPWSSRRQTPLSHSFCQHVVSANAPLIVEDARITPLVRDNLAIPDLGVIAYLGVPVHMPSGEPIGALCVIESKPRAWSDNDLSLLQQLADCVSDAIKMKAALLHVDQISREQREFTYAVSHDLKSPARTLNLLLHELELENAGMNEEGRLLLQQSQKTASRMMDQMTDILEYSRVLGARTRKDSIDLNHLIAELLDDLKGEIKHSGADVSFAPLPNVIGNRMQLRCLFQNLITNGIKFQPAGNRPVVHIRTGPKTSAAMVDIEVSDNGIGIRQEDQRQIFELFKRLHHSSDYDGSGIGLTLSLRICANHKGMLSVISEEGQGATFRVSLPEAQEA
ncbi:ATP-binding protein [Phycobacter sp. K97]|uniref:ATP-binding protein n=1 Tax=Phycobacter sedimenti TaxID=3133977 RepID=UPI00311F5684